MQARTLIALKVLNPLWSESDLRMAERAKQKYEVPQQLEVDAGYILTGSDCWIHCCPGDLNAAPIAEAVDDECREAVRIWMEEKRPAAIEQIRQALKNLDSYKNREDRERLMAMGRAYGLIGTTAATAEPAADKSKKKAEPTA